MMVRKNMDFVVGWSTKLEESPETYVTAEVPGAVQLDWAKAHQWDPYYFAENWRDYLWMEDCFWHYQATLDLTDAGDAGDKRVFLCGKGIDYHYVIAVDGDVVYEYEGMFSPFEVDLSSYRGRCISLKISLYPVPGKELLPNDRRQASTSCKAAVSYGWDWHPRLIPLGIWDEIYCEYREEQHIRNAEISYRLNDEYTSAQGTLTLWASCPPYEYFFHLSDPQGNKVFETSGHSDTAQLQVHFELSNPELWWPNGYGNPVLYKADVELRDQNGIKETWTRKVGFRKAELVMYPGGWDEPKSMPKSRSLPPITMRLNGRNIFCKGSNWVQPEVFYGLIDEAEYRTLLTFAKDAHFNMLRSWGGGIINKDIFFDLCDEMGIMVWQEFPLACNNYVGTPDYLRVLDKESRTIIQRLRGHACLVLWCGGNELFNAWSLMTDQSDALRLLNKNCYELDPGTPFIMSSPLSGMAHGGYVFRDEHGLEVYQVMNEASNTAYTEFACPSISDLDTLKLALPEEEVSNPSDMSSWLTHHGFHAWGEQRWAELDTLAYYFGDLPTIQEKIDKSNVLQCEGLKAIYEEARRQQPKCSMALNWCFCEPWPTAAGNNIISWKHMPKPAYYAVSAALRSTLVSARNSRFLWKEGETFEAEIWVLNDSLEQAPIGEITVTLHLDSKVYALLRWTVDCVPAQTNRRGPTACIRLPKADNGEMRLVLSVDGNPHLDSEYLFEYHHNDPVAKRSTAPTMNF